MRYFTDRQLCSVWRRVLAAAVCLGVSAWPGRVAHADIIDYAVHFDTSPISGSGDTYQLQFFLADGNGTPGDTTATIGTFNYGGGTGDPTATPPTFPDVTAPAVPNSTATVTQFGSTLDYQLHFDYTPDDGSPDGFSASIFDVTTSSYLPTDGSPDGQSFYTIDFTSSPVVNTYGSSAAGLAAPEVDPIPEPSTWAMFGLGALMLAWWQRRRKSGSVAAATAVIPL